MNEYKNAIELKNITKRYDGFTLDHVSFNVPKGKIMGFIGQNGAGKTTTIRSMLNVIHIDEGEINLLGLDYLKYEQQIKQRISVIFDELPFHNVFNANDIAKIFEGIYDEWNNTTYKEYLDIFQLPRKKGVGDFSKGMKMKLQIACALSHNAELVIMDEATAGLDPVVRDEVLQIFAKYVKDGKRSILMSSHITSDLDKIADSVTFINKGRVLLTGEKKDLIENHCIIRCSVNDIKDLNSEDVVHIRVNEDRADAMLNISYEQAKKINGSDVIVPTFDDIMLFYVAKDERGAII